ncbi:hypothetical protein [Leptodesmis sp.]
MQTPFSTGLYRDQKSGFMIIGAVGGFLFRVSMEALQELKEQRDREEKDS